MPAPGRIRRSVWDGGTRLSSRFAACDTTRAATPRAVVYLTPTTVSAPRTPFVGVIENLRRAEQLGASVPAAHGRHQTAMDEPDRVEGQVQRREGHVGVRDEGLDFGVG